MTALQAFAVDWLSPAVVRWMRRQRGGQIRFEGSFATWDEAAARCRGYEATDILAKVLAATLKVKRGEAVFERDSVLFATPEYVWPLLSGLMWSAACNGGKLNVLDFGGALGSSYFQHKAFLQAIPEVRWNVVEQAHYVVAGQDWIQDERLRFYPTIAACLGENRPTVVLLSSVLQYLPHPGNILLDLLSIGADAVVIDRTIVNPSSVDSIYVQHVPTAIYSASYPCRSLSESALTGVLRAHYPVVEGFASLNFPALMSVKSEFKGYICSGKR